MEEELGARETGDRRQETGDRSQESGVRSQESGVAAFLISLQLGSLFDVFAE
jgi:hypothetical protein